jgi:hypothetical protein
MRLLLSDLAAAVPRRWATPLLLGAGVLAAIGALLVLLATVFGTWAPAFGGTGCFAAAAVLWHLADGASH